MSSTSRTPPPHRVPTLTEVVEFVDLTEPVRDWERTERFVGPFARVAGVTGVAAVAATQGVEAKPASMAANEALPDPDGELVRQVAVDVQRQMDALVERRLREWLAPALSRLTESLVADVRIELASALRDTVVRAVADELARHRAR